VLACFFMFRRRPQHGGAGVGALSVWAIQERLLDEALQAAYENRTLSGADADTLWSLTPVAV
jgi:hypothetical protein